MCEDRRAGLVRIVRRGAGDARERSVHPLRGGIDVIGVEGLRRFSPAEVVGHIHALDLHMTRGDRAGLVQAEHVHASERLDAVELLRKHLATRETDGRDGEHGGGEKHEPLWDHAEQGTHRGEDGRRDGTPRIARGDPRGKRGGRIRIESAPGLIGVVDARIEQRKTDGYHEDAGKTHDGVQRVHDLGVDLLDVLRLVVDARDVVVGADMDHTCVHEPRIDEAAAHELIAGTLVNRVALTGEQALVHVALARDNDRVGRDLVSPAQADQVVEHELVELEFDLPIVANRDGALRGEQCELVHHALGAQGLHDADTSVEEHDPQKGQVLPGAGQDDERGQDDVDEVEQGAGVLDDEFLDRLGLELGVDVDLALRDALGDLG